MCKNSEFLNNAMSLETLKILEGKVVAYTLPCNHVHHDLDNRQLYSEWQD